MGEMKIIQERIGPGAARRYPPAEGTSTVAKIAVDLRLSARTGPQSAHLWWPAVAKLQAASVPIA